MRSLKKLFAAVLAIVMVLSLATTAMAAEDTFSITIQNENPGHTYEAYQIFSGELSNEAAPDQEEGTQAVLTSIVWGEGVTYNGQGVVVGQDDEGEDILSSEAADIARALETGALSVDDLIADLALGDPSGSTNTHVDEAKYVIDGLAAGYYLVKDADGTMADKYDAYTDYIVEVVEDSVVRHKSSVPSVEKKVYDINDTTGGEEIREDSADHDIYDDVNFIITAKLGNTVDTYTTYKVVFHDTMDKGLTLKATYGTGEEANVVKSGVTVKVDGVEKTQFFTITAVTDSDGVTTLTITCDDVKAAAVDAGNNSEITVEYAATLNEDANIGAVGNYNKVYLEFSNDPNWKPTPGEPGEPEEPEDPPTGKTPEDKVVVFTYDVIVNKTDEDGAALGGAAFSLYKKIGDQWVKQENLTVSDDGTTFTWTGIDDGDYKLVEDEAPAGFNKIDPIEFTVTAEHDDEATDPKLTNLAASGESGSEEVTFTSNLTGGSVSANVENKPGAVLPETGGVGTTVFYIIGGVMVAAAVVLLVTKKRMASAE